jgi:two-component system, chemotaxis family, sensor kinase CheA
MTGTGLDEARLRRAFLEEAEELSQKLADTLLALEADRGNQEIVNEVFRFTHSLKSEAALMGYQSLSELAHRMEDVLGLARDGTLKVDKTVIDTVFSGSDLIAEMMAAISKGNRDSEFNTTVVLQGLSAVVSSVSGGGATQTAGGAPAAGPAAHALGAAASPDIREIVLGDFERRQLAEARDRGESLFKITVRVSESEPMKFPRAYLVFCNLEMAANVVKTEPSMEGEPAEDSLYAATTLVVTSAGDERLLREAASVDQIGSVDIEPRGYEEYLSPRGAGATVSLSGGAGLAGSALQTGAAGADAAAAGAAAVERTSVRVDTRKLDDLWSLIAELVLHKSHLARLSEDLGRGADVHAVREELSDSFDSLEKISSGMQQAMMDTRMIPISVIFNKFPRLVRDLSRKLGKPVELILSGEDTEIDRSLVESLSDPLTHIIRNSLDHGIEFPEERVSEGKNERGRVTVTARRQGGNIVIEISDDGRGMDTGRIRQKAVAMGIEGAQTFSEAQLLDLVFLPGFSTKDVVTDLSGRGVGMDVVATRIRGDLKGDVELRTDPGKGTRVTLVLPLTLTIVNALLVRGDNQLFAIPLTDVDSTAKVLATEIRGEDGREISRWLEEDIPVYSLGALFGKGRRKSEEYFAAVLRHGDRKAFLLLDELIEEREIVIKPVDDLLNVHRMFSGASVLEDGRLVFILDTSLIRRENF